MADETDNLPVSIYGGDAILGSDVFVNNGETAHAQIMKSSWGDDNFTYKTNISSPLPVRIYGSSGDTNRVVVTGGIYGLGAFNVQNTGGSPLFVATPTGGMLGVSASIQGISGGMPVGVTGSVSIIGNVGITGLVSTTGGRALTFGTDSIRVYGEIGTTRGWKLTAANDTVVVSPIQGGFTHSTYIAGSSGNAIGSVSDSLKVYVSNVGFTIDATLSPIVYVNNATGGNLKVSGVTWVSETNPIPVVVRGTKAFANSNLGINSGDMVVSFVDAQSVQISNIPNIDVTSASNIYSYLHGNSIVGATASVGSNIASIQSQVSSISSRLANPVQTRSRNDASQTSSMRNWFVSLNAGAKGAVSIANTENRSLVPIQGTHIKNLTYLRSTTDPPPVTIGIGTQTSGGTGGFNLSLYLDPGESIFIPMGVENLYAQIVVKSINPSFAFSSYTQALGIMSI